MLGASRGCERDYDYARHERMARKEHGAQSKLNLHRANNPLYIIGLWIYAREESRSALATHAISASSTFGAAQRLKLGRHSLLHMAPTRRPPPALGRGENYDGGSPSIFSTSRYPIHRLHVLFNRSTLPTSTPRLSHHAPHVYPADSHLLRLSTQSDASSRDAATAEPRRRCRPIDSGFLWRGLPYPLLSYSARPFSRAPTRRLPRHQSSLPSGLLRLGISRTADSPSICLPPDQAHSVPSLPWPFDCVPPWHTSYRSPNRWVVSAFSASPALPPEPPPTWRSLRRPSALTPACAAFSLAFRPYSDTAQPVQPSSRQFLRRCPAVRSPCNPGWPPPDMAQPSARQPIRRPPALRIPRIPQPSGRPLHDVACATTTGQLSHRPPIPCSPRSSIPAVRNRSAQPRCPHINRPTSHRSVQSALPPGQPTGQPPTNATALPHASRPSIHPISAVHAAPRTADRSPPIRSAALFLRRSLGRPVISAAALPMPAALSLTDQRSRAASCSREATIRQCSTLSHLELKLPRPEDETLHSPMLDS